MEYWGDRLTMFDAINENVSNNFIQYIERETYSVLLGLSYLVSTYRGFLFKDLWQND